jgi:hypothetical protein
LFFVLYSNCLSLEQSEDWVGDEAQLLENGDDEPENGCILEWEAYSKCVEDHQDMHPQDYSFECRHVRQVYDDCDEAGQSIGQPRTDSKEAYEVDDDGSHTFNPKKNPPLSDSTDDEVLQQENTAVLGEEIFQVQTDIEGVIMLDGPVRMSILKPLHWEVVSIDQPLEVRIVVWGLNTLQPSDISELFLQIYVSRLGDFRLELKSLCPAATIPFRPCQVRFGLPEKQLGPGTHVLAGRIVHAANYRMGLGPGTEISFHVARSEPPLAVTSDSSYWKARTA